MSHMRIPMPCELERFVDRQVSDGLFLSAGEYVCALIREARLQTARRILDELQSATPRQSRAVPGGPEP